MVTTSIRSTLPDWGRIWDWADLQRRAEPTRSWCRPRWSSRSNYGCTTSGRRSEIYQHKQLRTTENQKITTTTPTHILRTSTPQKPSKQAVHFSLLQSTSLQPQSTYFHSTISVMNTYRINRPCFGRTAVRNVLFLFGLVEALRCTAELHSG